MTDKEIMQALNCCTSKSISCQKCPLLSKSKCERELIQYSFDLINRQQAEIERLKKEKERLSENVIAVMNSAENHYSELFDEAEEIVRAEAIKEFAEKLKDVFVTIDGTFECWEIEEHIDNLVKEMAGAEE